MYRDKLLVKFGDVTSLATRKALWQAKQTINAIVVVVCLWVVTLAGTMLCNDLDPRSRKAYILLLCPFLTDLQSPRPRSCVSPNSKVYQRLG